MAATIEEYVKGQAGDNRKVCETLQHELSNLLPGAENKVWHAHPVWFLDGNPIVGYSVLKAGVQLMFWSGADFDEPMLKAGAGRFKDASITYGTPAKIDIEALARLVEKAKRIQWDYKNIVKNKGKLVKRS